MKPIDSELKEVAVGYLTRRAGISEGMILGTRFVPATPEEVAPTRHWPAGLLATGHAAIADDVVLLACEAVTNAIRHSDSARPGADGVPGNITVVASEGRGVV